MYTFVKGVHLSLLGVLSLEVLSVRPLTPVSTASSTTTWGFSRKHQPLWTPTWSRLSWMTTVFGAPSDPSCFCKNRCTFLAPTYIYELNLNILYVFFDWWSTVCPALHGSIFKSNLTDRIRSQARAVAVSVLSLFTQNHTDITPESLLKL